MKSRSTSSLIIGTLMAVLFNTIFGIAIAAVSGIDIAPCVISVNAVGIGMNLLKAGMGLNAGYSALYVGLATEVYTAELVKKYRPNGSFLAKARDFSAYVSNDRINFAEAGADPDVEFNYDHVDVLPIADDEDTPKTVDLDAFSTHRSKITESQQDARAYAIMADRVQRHADTINEKILKYSATAFAPDANGVLTPIVRSSGAASGGFKKLTLDDVIAMDVAMRNLDVPGARILVLNPTHLGHLQSEDKDLFKGYVPANPDASFSLFGFEVFVSTATPRYTTDGGPVIKAWNAAAEDTDLIASLCFVSSEVARAKGSIKVFKDMDTASYQASFISARARFIAQKLRGKYVGALVAKTS